MLLRNIHLSLCSNDFKIAMNRCTYLVWCVFCNFIGLERATGIEPAHRGGLPNGFEDHCATVTPRPLGASNRTCKPLTYVQRYCLQK
jgi:hypothetical protein